MPTYDFEDENGAPVEVVMPMREVPGYGEWTTVDGRRLRRVIEATRVEARVPEYACVIRSQRPWCPTYPRTNELGQGVILNKREHADYQAKNPHLVWD